MSNVAVHLAVLRALDHARPDAAVTVLRPLLAQRLGARRVRLLLANYQLTALRPIQDPDDGEVLRDTPAGEVFATPNSRSSARVTRGMRRSTCRSASAAIGSGCCN